MHNRVWCAHTECVLCKWNVRCTRLLLKRCVTINRMFVAHIEYVLHTQKANPRDKSCFRKTDFASDKMCYHKGHTQFHNVYVHNHKWDKNCVTSGSIFPELGSYSASSGRVLQAARPGCPRIPSEEDINRCSPPGSYVLLRTVKRNIGKHNIKLNGVTLCMHRERRISDFVLNFSEFWVIFDELLMDVWWFFRTYNVHTIKV